MKKRLLFILFAIMLAAGCGSADLSSYRPEIKAESGREAAIQEQTEIPNAYRDIISRVYEFITADPDEREEDGMFGRGLAEACRDSGTLEERLSSIGYLLYDVDQNGIQELIIAERKSEGDRVLYMYTLDGDAPVLLAEGWDRSIIFLLEDDAVYQKGYSGDMFTSFSIWHIAEDGKDLVADAYYFTDYLNGPDDRDSLTWFSNTTGVYDMQVSEEAGFGDVEEGFLLMEEYEERKKRLDVVFYCDYALTQQ